MAERTELVCIHEGRAGHSIDPIFARAFIKARNPSWVRSSRFKDCGGKLALLERFPAELRACDMQGGNTTLIVLADVDDDCTDCEALKKKYYEKAKESGISDELFEKVIFIFPKDRIENWIEFLNTGKTDESKEGPRVKNFALAVTAAKELAKRCSQSKQPDNSLPPSLQWSCRNWNALVERMR